MDVTSDLYRLDEKKNLFVIEFRRREFVYLTLKLVASKGMFLMSPLHYLISIITPFIFDLIPPVKAHHVVSYRPCHVHSLVSRLLQDRLRWH